MSIQPNTTCDVYRAGNAPPSAPDLAAVPCTFISCFDLGREHGEKEAQQFRYTAKMLVAPTGDVRDNFNAWGGTASSRDTVYVPDSTGIGYYVNFVERIGRGLASDALCAYLDRLAVAWPYPGPAVLGVSPANGLPAGGTSVTITGRGFTNASAVNFGSSAAMSYTVNSDTQISATAPAVSAGTVDITVTTPLGTTATSAADQFTFSNIQYLQTATAQAASVASLTANAWPNSGTTQNGSLLVAAVMVSPETLGITMPSGWAEAAAQPIAGQGQFVLFYYQNAPAQTGPVSVTFTGTANYCSITACEISGLTSEAYDANTANTSTGTSISVGPAATSQTNEIWLAFFVEVGTPSGQFGSLTNPSGWTLVAEPQYTPTAAYTIVAATGTLTQGANWTAGTNLIGIGISFF